MWPLSTAAQKALAGTHIVDRLAQVTDPNGTLLATLDVVSGQTAEDETAAVRRTCTVTLATTSLVPSQAGDLLHPLSGNELRLYRGVKLAGVVPSTAAGGTLAPLGVFRTTKPQIADTGDQLTITVTGLDRSSEIARRGWTAPYVPTAGQTVGAAIQAILNSKWTGAPLQYNFAPSTVTVKTGTTLGVQFTSSGVQAASGSTSGTNDPWADCVGLAKAAGCELFFDRQGIVVMRPVPQPGGTGPVLSFVEGPACTMTQLNRTLDESVFYNGVILVGTGVTVTNSDGSTSPGVPVQGSAWSSDPQVGPSGPLGQRPFIVADQTVSTTLEANNSAAAWLPLVLATLDDISLTGSCNPALDTGDTIGVARARMKVSGTYIASAVTVPLDVQTAMQVTNRGFLVAAV